ncbi:MAG: molecular chaperone (small heat shock protein) [Candidatus Berkelbacteria bacterium Gr01-1014_85]|uniref:Molecular chaperone (Small heat shock protein) n=1 Tax=Candidatus Berkelbacteria bacterium Gr01-1014_85 TaxID=2017150 RepID=A0A554JBA0_9BACT|nr:MAG: molecular chaperone (small heat shock protein) [Candidatus Berkelbacteria bacterium Gr01-1014_85]
MTIIRRRPERFSLTERPLGQAIEELMRWPDLWEEANSNLRHVAADIYETEESVVAEMALPGVKPEDIDINVTGDTLTVSGETKFETTESKRNYFQRQLRSGSFSQSLILPASVQADKAMANFSHGMLKIEIPKAEAAKPKKIEVQVS